MRDQSEEQVRLELEHEELESLLKETAAVTLETECRMKGVMPAQTSSSSETLTGDGARFTRYREKYPMHDGTIYAGQVAYDDPVVTVEEDGDAYRFRAVVQGYGETTVHQRSVDLTARLEFTGSVDEDGLVKGIL